MNQYQPGRPQARLDPRSLFVAAWCAAAPWMGCLSLSPIHSAETDQRQDNGLLAELSDVNPYAPPDGLDRRALAEFILEMEDKPRSIQRRDGFTDGIVQAADQIMESRTDDRYEVIAALAKFKYLHRDACLGDEEAETALKAAVDRSADDKRQPIIREVQFLQVEQSALAGQQLVDDALVKRIDEIENYLADNAERLSNRHLRLASTTVKLINRLEDDETRESHFAELGRALVKSSDKELSRYGRRILGRQAQSDAADLVGKKLVVSGTTIDEQPFDWKTYRERVVLVDFWATWCGPCRVMLPQLQSLYDDYQEKGFDMVGVSLDQDLAAVREYLDENNMPWSQLAGEECSEMADRYGIRGVPTLILVDRGGTVIAVDHRIDVMEPLIKKLLNVAPPAE